MDERTETIKQILNYSFQLIIFIFLITLLLQQFYPFEVNSRININWFMVAVIVIGTLSIIFPTKEKKKHYKITLKDYIFVVVLGIIGWLIIFLKLNNLGWIGWIISILGGLIIIILSWLVLEDKKDNTSD